MSSISSLESKKKDHDIENSCQTDISSHKILSSSDINKVQGLKETFDLFNRMSDDLSSSYRVLEARVSALTNELDKVNAQKEIEAKNKDQITARLTNLLDLLPGGVIVLDRWGVINQINPAGENLLSSGIVGKKWNQIVEAFFSPKDDDGHEVSMKSGRRVSISTRSLDQEVGQIILITDQTETRRLQDELSRGQRLSALGKTVSALAHQIRTPLSAATLYASHLFEKDLTSVQIKDFSKKILARLNHLERQVQDMLIFAKGNLILNDSITMNDFLNDLRSAIDTSFREKNSKLIIENLCPNTKFICNSQSLIGALSNLINNSLQASQNGDSIHLCVEAVGDNLNFSIIDSGQGIQPNLLSRLKQGEEAFLSTKSQGTGLGLAVARVVAREHQGSLSIESKFGEGTRVDFKISQSLDITNELS
jgi:two-component system sensor histidine kinase FlrB